MTTKRPIPFAPDFTGSSRSPAGQSLIRAALAIAKTKGYGDVAATCRELFPDDRATLELVTRADAVPAATTTGVWGSTLAPTAVGEFISSLAPVSAAARLIDAGLRVSLAGVKSVLLPKRNANTPAVDVGWIGEGLPIGVHQRDMTSVELGPAKKLSALLVATSEVLAYTSGEQILGQLLREDVAATLDASMFDDTAADSTRPAGLLVGVTPIDASTATATRDEMLEDFAGLAGAICDLGGNGENIIFICSPRQAAYARLNLLTNTPVVIWPSTGLADGDIIAIQPSSFCSAFGSVPRIELAREASLVMTNPGAQLVAATGGVAVIADPTTSLFQKDLVGVRITLPCAWCLRAPLVATVSANWAKAPA